MQCSLISNGLHYEIGLIRGEGEPSLLYKWIKNKILHFESI